VRIAIVAALLVLLAAGAGVVWYGFEPDDAGTSPPEVPTGVTEPSTAQPGLDLPAVSAPDQVLSAALPADPVTAAAQLRPVLSRLVSSPKLGRHTVVQVSTPGADRPIWTSGVPPQVTPASTMKLLTCLTVLDRLGPQHRFETTVTQGPRPSQIALVGGGDPLLTVRRPRGGAPAYPEQATLASLARQTATAMQTDGVVKVSLSYDDSLFTGPAINPHWESSYVPESIIAPISSLWVDEGRAKPGLARRVPDPAATAAQRFARLLQARGLKVQQPRTEAASADAAVIASVESAPLQQIVQHVLEVSDNEGAEVLLRQAAIGAGKPASFNGGAAAVRETLTGYDIPTETGLIYDGSGLSRQDNLPIATLVQVLHTAEDPANPDLRPVVSSLPVAGFSGSLDYRFVGVAPGGLGRVRAKTGTLTGVHGLAGVVTTPLGHVLTFAAVADEVPVPRTLAARAQLDRIAAALASCRC
jgi:D-alanyl-D-alanine carboxypeptidase/D-alanyl-D-alanine-endopeptidase (penicillin-binding protein 4)